MVYDVLVSSLKSSLNSHAIKWVRNIEADNIVKAGEIAVQRHPDLGVTPTTVSMIWLKWPKPKKEKHD